MLDEKTLKDVLHREELRAGDKALIIIGSTDKPLPTEQIRSRARGAGLGYSFISNLTRTLKGIRGFAICTPAGWELRTKGRDRIKSLGVDLSTKPTAEPLGELRRIVAPIASSNAGIIATDAIGCVEAGLLRPGVVWSWMGAVSLLYETVVKSKQTLRAFNTEAIKRFGTDWRAARNADDLARMKESNFLLVLESISVIGRNVKAELEECLRLRNACGHPNSLQLGEHKAAAHLDTLLHNVYKPFTSTK